MKITNVRAIQPIDPQSPPGWRTTLGQILVILETDEGLTGYGVGGGGKAGIHVVQNIFRDLLIGQDPVPVEEHWQSMYQASLPFGRKGLAIMALSGVDLALWDLRGKVAERPVAELLGGTVEKPIPAYVTTWDDVTPELARKFSAFKLHVEQKTGGDQIENVVRTVAQTREIIGPEKQLMIDAWMRWDLPTTLTIAEKIKPYNVAWIEEPLPPDDLASYAQLTEQCPLPISGGEHEFTAIGFVPLIEQRLHQVLQPDVCWCGGLTELVKIYEMAQQAGLRVCPHRGAELWGLHALAALDPSPLAESGRPWMTWIGGQPPIVDGCIQLPHTPGFGVEIDEESLPIP